MKNKYFLGLDIGTDSIGWAVTDDNYNLKKYKGKSMWGIHLFEAGNTAEERRMHRSSRRRRERAVQRRNLLREFFKNEIDKIDSGFYKRMDDSFFYPEDKAENQTNALFNDEDYNDKAYYKDYKTIYHLRKTLIHKKQKFDIRLIYLAIEHILKHRGHFLYEGELNSGAEFNSIYSKWCTDVYSIFDVDLSLTSTETLMKTLRETNSITYKKKELDKIFGNNELKEFIRLLSGAKISIEKIFGEEYKDSEVKAISFKSGGFEDDIKDKLISDIGDDNVALLESTKSLYDWGLLAELLGNNKYISEAKADIYDRHESDLRILKDFMIENLPEKYFDMFKSTSVAKNYAAYVGLSKKGGKKQVVNPCTKDDFYSYIRTTIKSLPDGTNGKDYILISMDNGSFMPKQVTKDNSVIPYQLNLAELRIILNNASKYYDFLNIKDEYGTVSDKIISLLTFRIPYYVGPLNSYHKKYAWIEKKTDQAIRPWNFDDVVDTKKSAVNFISRMTNYCTYIKSEPVLAKSSILYCKYMVFNELNNIRINGALLNNATKLRIYNEVFLKKSQPKTKDIIKNIKANEGNDTIEISGLADDIKSNMKSYISFKNIIKDKIKNEEMVDDIIRLITIFGDEKSMLKSYINDLYSTVLSKDEIQKISLLNFSGWGRFSRKLLKGIYSDDTNKNIIELLIDTNDNFMQIINNDRYGFNRQIKEIQLSDENSGTYKSLSSLYVSPSNKKRIWRVMLLVKEIVKAMNCEPTKVFIEMARGLNESNSGVKDSRKKNLQALYKSLKNEKDLLDSIGNETESTLRQKKLYLYYMQLGRCMYSGKRLDIEDLVNCDIDHIIPQSKKSDDSLDNTVLVFKTLNAKKTDIYPIPSEVVSTEAKKLWEILKDRGFLSKEKYNKLTRKTPLTVDELADFVARQLVDTQQTTKIVADVFTNLYKSAEIVYVKSGNVSKFRHGSYIKKQEKAEHKDDCLIKVREINDYHHAKDAYLNIVVGNIYNEKFGHNPKYYIKSNGKYNLARICEFDVKSANWIGGFDGTIKHIKDVMKKNNILYTEMPYELRGGLFDQQIVKKCKGQFPLKITDDRYSINKYGGYNKISGAYFTLIQATVNGKTETTIESVPVYWVNSKKDTIEGLKEYFTSQGLTDVKILIPKIKLHSLLKIDGTFVRVTGRSNNTILLCNSVPLCIGIENELYIKKIIKYIDSTAKNSTYNLNANHNGINSIDNLKLYDLFIDKLKTPVYSRFFSPQIKNLCEGRSIFIELELSDQNVLLYNILKLFNCNKSTANLSLIGKAKSAGIISINKKVNNECDIKIINQSITGLFENVTDINKLL